MTEDIAYVDQKFTMHISLAEGSLEQVSTIKKIGDYCSPYWRQGKYQHRPRNDKVRESITQIGSAVALRIID